MKGLWIVPLAVMCCGAKEIDEGLELRRIAEYWEERDFSAVKRQISTFLSAHGESSYCDLLYGMLGDVHFREKDYAGALSTYGQIQGEEVRERVAFQRLQCLFNVGNYEAVVTEVPARLQKDLGREEKAALQFCLAESRAALGQQREALAEYQQLAGTSYFDQTLLPQAAIFTALKDYERAAATYLLLAGKVPERQEEYLFYAAGLQVHEDRRGAIETFRRICALNGKTAPKAAFNALSLLFQERDYRGLILAHEELEGLVPEEKGHLVQYYLGISLLEEKDYARAVVPLMLALEDAGLEQRVLLKLVGCANALNDAELFDRVVGQLVEKYGGQEETLQAMLLHLQRAREKGEWGKVHKDVALILGHYPDYAKRDALVYDEGLALVQERRWQEAGDLFEGLVKGGAEELKSRALRHLIHSRQEAVRCASEMSARIKQELLRDALELSKESSFSTREKRQLRFLSAANAYALGREDEAIVELSEYCEDFANDSSCAEAHLLLAECYRKGSDPIHFALHAEKALSLGVKVAEPATLHIALYNTYLELATVGEDKREMLDLAADHLFSARAQIKNAQNLRWLADHYLQSAKRGAMEGVRRAVSVLEQRVCTKPIDVQREAETIRLAQLYGQMGEGQKKVALLEALKHTQESTPGEWKYQRMAAFELALSCERQRALEILDQLIEDSAHSSSYYAQAAKLERAKLLFAAGSIDEERICDDLKQVELQRRLYSEPLHLEAALFYIDVKAAKEPDRAQELLAQMRERFERAEDPIVTEYFAAKAQFPDKELLFRQYMSFVDLEEKRLGGKPVEEALDQLLRETKENALKARIMKSKERLAGQ